MEMLEGLHFSEADIILAAKDKDVSKVYKSITEDLVREAFPNMLPPPQPKPAVVKKSTTKKSSTSVGVWEIVYWLEGHQ